jgi:periplasmic protein TonB
MTKRTVLVTIAVGIGMLAASVMGWAADPPQKVRVGGGVMAANLISKVNPVYPPEAKQAGTEGTVRLAVDIGPDGKVVSVNAQSGPDVLVQAAVEAVRQWTYKATLLNGEPVEVLTTVDVNFTLTQ